MATQAENKLIYKKGFLIFSPAQCLKKLPVQDINATEFLAFTLF